MGQDSLKDRIKSLMDIFEQAGPNHSKLNLFNMKWLTLGFERSSLVVLSNILG